MNFDGCEWQIGKFMDIKKIEMIMINSNNK